MAGFTLETLDQIIADRVSAAEATSYTKSLLASGRLRVAKKFGEEAVETVIAAVDNDAKAVTLEAADSLYHLLVLLRASGVALSDVMLELERRQFQSGLQEKASRNP